MSSLTRLIGLYRILIEKEGPSREISATKTPQVQLELQAVDSCRSQNPSPSSASRMTCSHHVHPPLNNAIPINTCLVQAKLDWANLEVLISRHSFLDPPVAPAFRKPATDHTYGVLVKRQKHLQSHKTHTSSYYQRCRHRTWGRSCVP